MRASRECVHDAPLHSYPGLTTSTACSSMISICSICLGSVYVCVYLKKKFKKFFKNNDHTTTNKYSTFYTQKLTSVRPYNHVHAHNPL